MRTIIQQLARNKDGSILKPILDKYEGRRKSGQVKASLSCKESQDVLGAITDILPLTTICIDALDEVDRESRNKLLHSLKHVVESSRHPVKIFATTRMDGDILHQLREFPRIEIEADDNIEDIILFVNDRVRGIVNDGLLHVSPEVQQEVCSFLCEKAKGMYVS